MAAVTKGSGKYFDDFERVWTEALDAGVQPFWVGKAANLLNLPAQPNPQAIKALCDGRAYLSHVQANRSGCFDLTVSMSKSVSLVAYGLTPPAEWKGWTQAFDMIVTPKVEKHLASQRINSGAQGQAKVPSQGVAVAFWHREGYQGQPQAHAHYAIPNVSIAADGKVGSIANANELFENQGVLRARIQKGVDDELQSRGFETVRVGKGVELAGIPRELILELSPARRAMDAAQSAKGFNGPHAQDFYARQARRDAGARVHSTPEECHRDVKEVAARHGVTLDSLQAKKGQPVAAHDPVTATAAALHAAKEAVERCAKKYGAFTAEQFQEKLFTLAIGKPTTVQALDTMGKAVLQDRSIAQVRERKLPDGTTRYEAPASAKAVRAAQRSYKADTKEAWDELKAAAKGLGAAVFVATAKKATAVVERLAEAVNPPAKTIRVDAGELAKYIEQHKPTHYVKAHATALLSGLFKGSGNPHERADHAEKVYARLRAHDRLPKNAVIVVERGDSASAKELRELAKIAKRDGASVVLSERDPHAHQTSRQQSHRNGHPRTP